MYNGGVISTTANYSSNYDTMPMLVNSSGYFGRYLHDTTSIGGRVPEQNYSFLSGDIAEIIVYNRVLNTTEVSTVETYLIAKYGFYNTCIPLEVRMTSFSANAKENGVRLKWEMTNENNVSGYIAERSTDNLNWEEIGSKILVDLRKERNQYDLTDLFPSNGINYYRIRTTTSDGQSLLSEVRMIHWNFVEGAKLCITPNPCTGHFLIRSPAKEALQVSFMDCDGRIKKRISTFSNTLINASWLPPGIYFITSENKSGMKTYKLIKK
jgi:hypothetical protein